MDTFTPSQINIVLQVVILTILCAGLALKKKNKFFFHGTIMLIAVLLNVFSFLLVMLPSLLSLEVIVTQPASRFSLVILAHASLGAVVIALAIWLTATWHLSSDTRKCFRRKLIMRVTSILWMITLLLGIVLYWYLYGF